MGMGEGFPCLYLRKRSELKRGNNSRLAGRLIALFCGTRRLRGLQRWAEYKASEMSRTGSSQNLLCKLPDKSAKKPVLKLEKLVAKVTK